MTAEAPDPQPQSQTHEVLDDLIQAAEARGDFGTSGVLKLEKMRLPEEDPSEPSEAEAELDRQIQEAEAAEDFERSGQLKMRRHQLEILNPTGDEIDVQTREQIAAAEENEDWDESLRLKSQVMGGQ